MRAAQLDANSIVINYAQVTGFNDEFIDPLNSVMGSYWDGTNFINPSPPVPPPYPPDTPEQSYLEYKAMIYRRADALEANGDIIGALLLRESVK